MFLSDLIKFEDDSGDEGESSVSEEDGESSEEESEGEAGQWGLGGRGHGLDC